MSKVTAGTEQRDDIASAPPMPSRFRRFADAIELQPRPGG